MQKSIDKLQQICYYTFATKCNKEIKGGKFIEKNVIRQLHNLWYEKKGECIFCGEIKNVCNHICKKCLEECYNEKTGISFVAYQTKLIKALMKYNLKKELSELYYEKYNKIFCIEDKDAKIFLREYCLEDKECFSRYILNNM